jgi:GT2 family glycosyltransferase
MLSIPNEKEIDRMRDDNQIIASVIVVAYNDKKYLEACLSSLLDQDMPEGSYEVIYADNASTDGSVSYVEEKFPTVRIIRHDKNYGFAMGNNLAAEYAKGRYICFQNADTVAHRRWLVELINAVQSDPQAKASHAIGLPLHFGRYHERSEPLKRGVMCDLTRFGYVDFTEVEVNQSVLPTLHVAGGSFLVDSEIQDKLRYYFDPTYFIYNEDTDLGIRINNLGYKVLFTSKAPMYHERAAERRTLLNKKSLRMTFLVTRNRFITFYKNMYGLEFLITLPLLCLGTIIKLRTLPMSTMRKVIYALGLIPFTLYSLFMAVIRFPLYTEQRRYILSNRLHPNFWLLKELWRRPIPPATPLSFGIDVA